MGDNRKPSRLAPTPRRRAGRKPEPAKRLSFRRDLVPSLRSRKLVEELDDPDELPWEDEGLRDEEKSAPRRMALWWGGVVGGVLCAVAVWMIVAEGRKWPQVEEAKQRGSDAEIAGREMKAATAKVMNVVSSFLHAESLEKKMKWVVPSEELETRMGNYYERHPTVSKEVYDFPVIALTVETEGNFYTVQALCTDGSEQSFYVPVTPAGPLIAWEAHVGYCEVDWDDFLDSLPADAAEMRVYIEPSNYYQAPYEDRDEYLSVEISRPRSERRLFGFVSKSRTRGVEGMAGLLISPRPEPAVLRLRIPPEQRSSERPFVEVEEFVQGGWFKVPPTGSAGDKKTTAPLQESGW